MAEYVGRQLGLIRSVPALSEVRRRQEDIQLFSGGAEALYGIVLNNCFNFVVINWEAQSSYEACKLPGRLIMQLFVSNNRDASLCELLGMTFYPVKDVYPWKEPLKIKLVDVNVVEMWKARAKVGSLGIMEIGDYDVPQVS